MKRLIVAFCLALSLVGCAAFSVHDRDTITNASPAVKVSYAIDQINASIAAAAQTIVAETQAGALTKSEERVYAADLQKITAAVKVAEATLAGGDPLTAQGQLAIAQQLLNLVQQQLIAAQAKGK